MTDANDEQQTQSTPPPTPFHDLDAFLAVPRVSSLTLSPDGSRLVTVVSQLAKDGTRFRSSLWELDPAGARPARRLTRSDKGESAPAFRADGALLFLSGRDDPENAGEEANGDGASLWALPADGGEAEKLLNVPGGVGGYAVPRAGSRLAWTAGRHVGAEDAESDNAKRKAREKAKVGAILHEGPLVRYWDHDLGPDVPHLFTAADADATAVDAATLNGFETEFVLSPDGSLVAYTLDTGDLPDELRTTVVVADAATGKTIRQIGAPGHEFTGPVFTADGRSLVLRRTVEATWDASHDSTLWLVSATDEQDSGRDLLPGFDAWPGWHAVSPAAGPPVLFFAADEEGRSPVFRLDTADGSLTRLTATGAYTDLTVSPDGSTLYALRAAVDAPPTPVRLDATAADQEPVVLPAPGGVGTLPGSLTEVHTTAQDGTPLRAWLVLPDGASAERPAPLLLWVHGGPQMSWNAWTWRWNPWVAAARGYAVLLPDPALSTGYGQRMHERGWGRWGDKPYTDVLALTDAALERDDLDGERTAMMGGSFGGYMANWIATRTDRFQAIVTHASLWNLHAFSGTTDATMFWRRHFGDPLKTTQRLDADSPHLRAADIRTPMLVVHGDKDYRVPIGEALALWTDLTRHGVPAKFLYFPDEGHWVLKPNNAKLWYTTVLNFLAHHVLGEEWVRPELV